MSVISNKAIVLKAKYISDKKEFLERVEDLKVEPGMVMTLSDKRDTYLENSPSVKETITTIKLYVPQFTIDKIMNERGFKTLETIIGDIRKQLGVSTTHKIEEQSENLINKINQLKEADIIKEILIDDKQVLLKNGEKMHKSNLETLGKSTKKPTTRTPKL